MSLQLDPVNISQRIRELEEQLRHQRIAEQELRQSAEFLQAVIDGLQHEVVVLDHQGTVLFVNAEWIRMAQINGMMDPNYGVGTNYLRICHEARGKDSTEAPSVYKGLRSVLDRQTDRFYLEYPCEMDHVVHWFALKASRFEWDGHHYLLLVHEDVTERKQAETELKLSQTRLASIVNTAVEGILVIDDQGKIDAFNPAAERLFGYPQEEVIGQHIEEFISLPEQATPDQYWASFIQQTGRHESVGQEREVMGRRKDGTTFPLSFSISEMRLGGKRGFTGLLRDITEPKQREQELRMAQQQAEAANQAKTRFLANMSHEIRTPLNAIVGFSQILLNRVQDLDVPREFRQYLEDVQLSSQHLSELINNILDLSKIEAGKTPVVEEDVYLHLLLKNIFHINNAQALQKNLKFSYRIGPQVPERIRIDRSKLNQILMNLVGNAVKFTSESKSVILEAVREGDTILFRVIDQGIGISQDRWEQIFQAFEQVDDTITRHFGGTGLGLAITRNLVLMMGGSIWVDSQLGVGSTFFVKLPFVEVKSQAMPNRKSHAASYRFSPDHVILMIEDDRKSREMMQALCEDMGLTLHLAENGSRGVSKALELQPDLIFVDMHMPAMDGLEVTKTIRHLPGFKKLPIVALSADAFTEKQQAALELGITEYLTKPLEYKKFLTILKKYLRQAPSTETVPSAVVVPQMPDSLRSKLHQALRVFTKLPIYQGEKVLEQIESIRELCEPFDTPYLSILQQLETALFHGDVERFEQLINDMTISASP